MRHFINKYGIGVMVIALLGIVAAAVFSLQHSHPQIDKSNGDPSLAFYVDEDTGEESVGPAEAIPPLVDKNGKRTVVQECKLDFGGSEGVKTVYLLKYSDEALAQMAHHSPTDPQYDTARLTGRLVRRPGFGSPWVAENSPEGMEIVNNNTPGPAPQPVYPKR